MRLIAGVDIGNSTTEVCIGSVGEDGRFQFPLQCFPYYHRNQREHFRMFTGSKLPLRKRCSRIGMPLEKLDLVRLNEAAPVIGDTAMETITETIITESSMIGHNPATPAGAGEAVGRLLFIQNI